MFENLEFKVNTMSKTDIPEGEVRIYATASQRRWPPQISMSEGYAIMAFDADTDNPHVYNQAGERLCSVRSVFGTNYFTAKGPLLRIREGLPVLLIGEIVDEKRFGPTMTVTAYDMVLPIEDSGVEAMLQAIKHIGPVTAKNILTTIIPEGQPANHIFNILDGDSDRAKYLLCLVNGISDSKAAEILEDWDEQRYMISLIGALAKYGIAAHLAARIYKAWRGAALEKIEANPYDLTKIRGIGFATADHVAIAYGIPKDDARRIEAGLVEMLRQAMQDGSVYLPREKLIDQAFGLFQKLDQTDQESIRIDSELIADTLESVLPLKSMLSQDRIEGDTRLVEQTGRIYTRPIWEAERTVASQLKAILSGQFNSKLSVSYPDRKAVDTAIEIVEADLGFKLDGSQRQAMLYGMTEKVLIITGGPGVGKTSITKALLNLMERGGIHRGQMALCAPTGRAAKRMTEQTGREAMTVHRLLGYGPDGTFEHDHTNQLECEVVVIDEASMLDTWLAAALLGAIPSHAHLMIIGDPDQLPSVGPGNVLQDMLDSGVLPVARLEVIHRQSGQKNLIVENAAKIRDGDYGLISRTNGDVTKDCYLIMRDNQESPESRRDFAVGLVSKFVPERLGYSMDDIAMIVPQNVGAMGIDALNPILQDILNPANHNKPEIQFGNSQKQQRKVFRRGDLVMQIRNNYQLDVMNGDVGKITAVRPDGDDFGLTVEFDGLRVTYERDDLYDLKLAYSCTAHKTQGSEYPCVVIVLHRTNYRMLTRRLFYTAFTRAKQTVIVVCDEKMLAHAIRNNPELGRYSSLAERLVPCQR